MLAEPLDVIAKLVAALDRMGIDYLVGGSFASSIYGIPRATQDVDLVVDMKVSDAQSFAELLAGDFYVDVDMIKDAIRYGRAFNVIHLKSMFKADFFTKQEGAWTSEELARARTEELIGPQGPFNVRFASPEDTLLHKLVWFQMGGESSDRQWTDILGVLGVQGDGLDGAYLDHWAAVLDVAELLARARRQRPGR